MTCKDKEIELSSIRKFEKRASADVSAMQTSLTLPGILIVPIAILVLSNLVGQPNDNTNPPWLGILLAVMWGCALLLLVWMFNFPLRLLERANISTIILRACIERGAEIEKQKALASSVRKPRRWWQFVGRKF